MGASLSLHGYASKEDPEFKKHLKSVKFCIENDLLYPKETSEFFKGKMHVDNLEDWNRINILEFLEDRMYIKLPTIDDAYGNRVTIKVADIPEWVVEIVATFN